MNMMLAKKLIDSDIMELVMILDELERTDRDAYESFKEIIEDQL